MQKKRLVGCIPQAAQTISNELDKAQGCVFFLQKGMYVWRWNWAKQNQLIKDSRKLLKGGKQKTTSYLEV